MIDNLNLPDTSRPADHTYFDGAVESYDFRVNGHNGTLGIIKPGFKGEFPTDEGGEDITLAADMTDAGLSVEVVNQNGQVEDSRVLTKKGQQISAVGGTTLRVATSGEPASYICIYPGRPVAE